MSKNRRKKVKKAARSKTLTTTSTPSSSTESNAGDSTSVATSSTASSDQQQASSSSAGASDISSSSSSASDGSTLFTTSAAQDKRALAEDVARTGASSHEQQVAKQQVSAKFKSIKEYSLSEESLEHSLSNSVKEREEKLLQLVKSTSVPVGDRLKRLHASCIRLLHDNKRIQTEILFLSRKFEETSMDLSAARNASLKTLSEKTALETYCLLLEKKCTPEVLKKVQKRRPDSLPKTSSAGQRKGDPSDGWDPLVLDNLLLPQEGDSQADLHEKLLFFSDQYARREQHFLALLRSKELQNLFLGARLKQQLRAVSKADTLVNSYKQQASTLSQTESELRGQLALYAEKFEQFQVTLTKSNEVFNTFKQEMERMTKTIKKLEKENLALRQKREKAELRMIDMQEDRNKLRRQLDLFHSQNQSLKQLCRTLQEGRKKADARAQAISAGAGTASNSVPSSGESGTATATATGTGAQPASGGDVKQ